MGEYPDCFDFEVKNGVLLKGELRTRRRLYIRVLLAEKAMSGSRGVRNLHTHCCSYVIFGANPDMVNMAKDFM